MRTKLVCYLRGHRWKDYTKSGGYYQDRHGFVHHKKWYYSRCLRCGWDTNEDHYYREMKQDWQALKFKVKNFIRGLFRKPPEDDIPF